MSAAADTRLRGATRWSMTARCPRQAVYAYLGAEPEQPDEEQLLLMERGKLDQQWYVDNILVPLHGRENLVLEKPVPWPAKGLPVGELHIDIFLRSQRMPIEVKSHADGDVSEDDIVQLGGEILFDPESNGKTGTLVQIDRNLRRDTLPVTLTKQLRKTVEERAAQVVEATRTGVLPDRVCGKRSDARGRFCPFADICFEGVVEPVMLNATPELEALAPRLLRARIDKDAAEAKKKEAEKDFQELAARAVELGVIPGHTYLAAGVEIRRTAVGDQEYFGFGDAKKCGAFTDTDRERFQPFIESKGAHNRWTVKPTMAIAPSPEPAEPEDYGDVPF